MSSYEVQTAFLSAFVILKPFQIFTSTPPWGVLSENHIYQLVVRENDRPDRPDPNFMYERGLTDQIWEIMESAWQKEGGLRPTFTQIMEWWYRPRPVEAPLTTPPLSRSSSLTGQIPHFIVIHD